MSKTILQPKPTPLTALKPYANNPRKITPAAIEQVAKSIKEYGWQSCIIADKKGEIINGHTRHAAALKLQEEKAKIPNWADTNTCPAVIADLPPNKARALRIADNRTGELSQWDLSRLALEVKEINLADTDAFTALSAGEISGLFVEAVPIKDANEGIADPRRSKPPIGYYGGKQQLTPIIMEWAESVDIVWDTWIEPYAGGAACAFALPDDRVKSVIINDKNDNVVEFWRHIKEPQKHKALCKLIDERELICEKFRDLARDIFRAEKAEPVERAWALSYLTWTSIAKQIVLAKNTVSLEMKHYNRNDLERIRNFAIERMKKFIICDRDAIDVMKVTRKAGCFYFIDTPYLDAEQGHYSGYTAEDFQKLLDLLKTFGNDVPFLLTTYENEPIIKAIKANGWYCLKIKLRSIVSSKAHRDETIKTHGAQKTIKCQREEWLVSNKPPPKTLLGQGKDEPAKRAPNKKPSPRKKSRSTDAQPQSAATPKRAQKQAQ